LLVVDNNLQLLTNYEYLTTIYSTRNNFNTDTEKIFKVNPARVFWVPYMNDFYIQVKNGLLDPKHFERIGDAVWLFMWLLDKQTIINHETGESKILGGKPVTYEDVNETLPISRPTYNRWVKILRDGGYITTVRTPQGLSFTLHKSFKVFGQKVKNKRSIKNESSDVSEMNHQMPINDTSIYSDITQDKTVDTSTNVEGATPPVNEEFGDKDINEGIKKLQEIGVTHKLLMNRYALKRLYGKHGKEKTLKVWDFAQKMKDRPYCPQIHNFLDLEVKWHQLESFAKGLVKPDMKGVKSVDATKILRGTSGERRDTLVAGGIRAIEAIKPSGNQSSVVLGQNALDSTYQPDRRTG
jgi:hypothetical protein